MKRSILLILACFLVFAFSARSQNQGIKASANPKPVEKPPMYQRTTQDMATIQNQSPAGASTSPSGLSDRNAGPYLEPGWVTGHVRLKDQSQLDGIMLRYDLYNQQIQFIRDEDTLAFSKPEEVEYFLLDGKKIVYSDYDHEGVKGKSFFEVLTEGDCKLMVRWVVTYHVDPDANPAVTGDVYVRECQYYIEKKDDLAKPVKACRKSVLCAFKDKEDQIRDYLDQKGLKMNTCDQLKEVVTYYNSLP